MLLLAAAALLLGFLFLTLGLRGRRIDTHPVCRSCGFDLVGLSLPRCPECGADASRPRTGNRRRVRPVIALGLVLMLAALGVGGAIGWGRVRAFNWNTIKPEWWLAADARSLDGTTVDAALDEFASRFTAGTLSKDRAGSLLAEALSRQADPNQSWSPGWGDLLEAMFSKGALTKEQTTAYARAAPVMSMSGRDSAVQDGNWRPALNIRGGRVSATTDLAVVARLLSLTIDGAPVEKTPQTNSMLGLGGGNSRVNFPVAIHAAPGPHTVVARWALLIQQGYDQDAPTLATWEQDFSVPLQVLPAGSTLVTLLHDDSARPVLERRIVVSGSTASPATDPVKGKVHHAFGTMIFRAPPVPLAHRLFWRYTTVDGQVRESYVDTIICAQSNGQSAFSYQGELPGDFSADHVDLILRPDPAAASETESLTQIWDGEVTIRNIPVKINGGQ